MENQNLYLLPIEEGYKLLNTREEGLHDEEANKRLMEHGANKIEEGKRKGLLSIFLSQFGDFMIWILIAAGGISGFLGEWIDAGIILFVVVMNAVLGTIQESKAEAALEALKDMAAPFALVIRGGLTKKILSQELVPGDVVVLNAGDSIPADLRIIRSNSLKVDESALTGESVPRDKDDGVIAGESPLADRDNMAYMGTAVTYGRGLGLVVATGMQTEIGNIAKALTSTGKETTPLQNKLNQISNYLSIGVIIIAIVIFLLGFLSGDDLLDSFLTAVSLAVAAIPEGLVAVITIVLAIGMTKLAKDGAIIRKLPAVETLGSTQIICSDKTGTLTQNKMTVQILQSEHVPNLEQAMLHCNDSVLDEHGKLIGDPTETALIEYLLKEGKTTNEIIAGRKRSGEIPFDSGRKKSTVVIALDNGYYRVYVKGALDNMLDSFILSDEDKEAISAENDRLAQKALRVLAFGFRDLDEYDGSDSLDLEKNLKYLGLVGMIDPPRPEAKAAIEVCRRADILPVMITGDHKITAVAIAEELGMLSDHRYAITGAELSAMEDAEFRERIEDIAVYARVAPEDKTRIVKMWQSKGKIVAMTGDGVNDAPALKASDIGVGMGITGTEVSKGASDMVLTDDNFATIVTAIREGRRIFDNIHKTISFLLSSNTGEVIAILTATLIGWHILSPVHILWVNLVTDAFPALALGVEPGESNIMTKKPRDSRLALLTGRQWLTIGFFGIMEAGLTLGAYVTGLYGFGDATIGTTMAFLTLSCTQLFAALGFQSKADSIFKIKPGKHPMLWLGFFGSLFLQLVVVLVEPIREIFELAALNGIQWLATLGFSIAMLLLIEVYKFISNKLSK